MAEGFILHFETACTAVESNIGLPLLFKTVVLLTAPSLASMTCSLTEPSEPFFRAELGNSGFGAESQSEVAPSAPNGSAMISVVRQIGILEFTI
jgi:hypothetical protein